MAKTNNYIPNNSTKQNINTEEFEIKFQKSVESLNKGLTAAQKKLNLVYDENRRLNNSFGQCVEGLSAWQIKLGMWIDGLGRARTANNGFADGLSRTELELGFYADLEGKVREQHGRYIRDTKAAIEAEKERNDALHQTREAFADAFDAIGNGAGRFASLLTQIGAANGQLQPISESFSKIAGEIDFATQAFGAFQNILVGFKKAKQMADSLNGALAQSATTAQGLKAVLSALGGPWGLLLTAVGAATAAVFAFSKATNDAQLEQENSLKAISDSFSDIERKARDASDQIKGLNDVLKYGAFSEQTPLLDKLQSKIDEAQDIFDKAVGGESKTLGGQSVEHYRKQGFGINEIADYGKVGATGDEKAAIDEATSQYKQALDDYNKAVEDIANQLRQEQLTEKEKLEALRGQYEKSLENVKNAEVQDLIEKKIASINQKIADVDAKELETQQKKLADQRAALSKDLGISFDFTPVKSQTDAMADDLAKLSEAFQADPEMFGGVKGALEEAENRIRQKYSDQNLATFSDSLKEADSDETVAALKTDLADKLAKGLLTQDAYDKAQEDATKKLGELTEARIAAIPGLRELLDENGDEDDDLKSEADRQYAETMDALDKALQERLVGEEKYAELARRADEKLAKAKEAEASKLMADARSKLGIDAIMEELKTPTQKYNEKLQEATEALDKNQINPEEFQALQAKLQKTLFGKDEKLEMYANKLQEPKAEKAEKEAGPAKSMEAGSADLYLAQVKNSTAEYQRQIQTTTAQMAQSQLEALEENRMTNYYLAEMLDSGMNIDLPVWG